MRNLIQSIEAMDAREVSQSLAEKRRSLRIRSYVQVRLQAEGQDFKGVVVELGLEGLRVKSPDAPLEEGQTWDVVFAGEGPTEELGPVRMQTAWSQRAGRDMIAGARYVDSRDNMRKSWVRRVLQELGFEENKVYQRRQFIRVDASIPSRLFDGTRCVLNEARVVNLGIGGALLESATAMEKNASLTLEISLWRILPTLRLPVTVLDVRPDLDTGLQLHSLQFGPMEGQQIKILGNYIINMINQTHA